MANVKSKALTDLAIQKMKRPAHTKWVRDGDGLALCLKPGLAAVWRCWYFIYISPETGKKVYKPLGDYPDLTISSARDEASLLRGELLKSVDPKAKERRAAESRAKADEELRRQREAEASALTVLGLFSEYLNRHALLNKRQSSVREDKRIFDKDIGPSWGERKVADIGRKDFIALLDRYVDRPALCVNIKALISKMFNFAVEKSLIDINQLHGIKAPVRPVSRERVLTNAEIYKLWTTELSKSAMSAITKRLVKFCLVTGQRVGEICQIHESQIEGRWWTIPREFSKNKQIHRVYLTDTALDMLMTPLNGFYFPSHAVRGHIQSNSVSQAIIRNLKDYQPSRPIKDEKVRMVQVPDEKKMDLAHFTPHDLRRTFSTGLARLGFRDEVIDAVTNHKKQGIIRVYNRHQYDQEKQQAMVAWERELLSIIHGNEGKVIPMIRKHGLAH
ncbi:MAG: tyrosine-type recombinase/integrase [Geobacter sp.]